MASLDKALLPSRLPSGAATLNSGRHQSVSAIAAVIPSSGTLRAQIGSRDGSCSLPSAFVGTAVRATTPFSRTVRPGRLYVNCGNVRKVTAQELNDVLLTDRSQPIVVDFYATWCGPCVLLAQELEQLALEYNGEVKFLKVDTDEEYELASQLEIRGLPTMIFISSDETKLASRTEGLLPRDTIKGIIEEL